MRIFIDKDIKELALDEKEPHILKFYHAFWGTHISALIFALLFLFVGNSGYYNILGIDVPDNIVVAFLPFVIYIAISVFVIFNLDKINQNTFIEYKKSEERLMDPLYVLALQKAGFKVPEKYLSYFTYENNKYKHAKSHKNNYCFNCGIELQKGSKFCEKCGMRVFLDD